jgi:glycosyltransferase involved in cell wall biosynthesis
MLPSVSIITPSYNQAAYLEATLRSVLEQDYPQLEYLLVDGLSSDNSVEIIQRCAARLAWWVSEKDKGQAEAINKGFARATGDIVAWLNSDDVYLPGAIRAAVKAFETHPEAGLVFGDVVSINAAGEPINVMTFGDWGLDELLQFKIISQPAVFMRRAVLERAGYLDPNFHFMLDHHLWLRMAQLAPMVYVPERWACARFHENAKNVSQAPGFAREATHVADWIEAQPSLQDARRRLGPRIRAGAQRINGFYLLDAGQPRAALWAYLKSLALYPPAALPDWRRILFAAASLFVDVSRLRRGYLSKRKARFDPPGNP